MEKIKRFQVRGITGEVQRVRFGERIVDYWVPRRKTSHLLIAHDGQNVFDKNTATRRRTWRMAQSADRVFSRHGLTPPVIIGVFHSSTKENPWGRAKDLTPPQPFKEGVEPIVATRGLFPRNSEELKISDLRGDEYLAEITDVIAPKILQSISTEISNTHTAIIGSSMGGLASLYALAKRPDFFATALALSPHWVIGEKPLAKWLTGALPEPAIHKVWMSRGTKGLDAQYESAQKYADALMLDRNYRIGRDFSTKIYNRTGHNEKSWASYLDQVFEFLLT